jgi:hypothetical protein
MESLILAQNERWRRGLGMQVERDLSSLLESESGERVRNIWVTCLQVWNSLGKLGVMPDVIVRLIRIV